MKGLLIALGIILAVNLVSYGASEILHVDSGTAKNFCYGFSIGLLCTLLVHKRQDNEI